MAIRSTPNLYFTGFATGLEDRLTLCTGLDMPAVPNWTSCNVVVRRRGGEQTKFCVRLWRLDLAGDEDNGRLWREVTARVPFADWAALEIIRKYYAPRRHVMRLLTWHARRTPRLINGVNEQEQDGRRVLHELQDHVIDIFLENTVREEWTLIIHTR
jgi:hypothetical protein